MSDYYLRFGATSGDGSSGSPYGSFTELQANETLASGDTVYISNLAPFLEGQITFSGLTLVSFLLWDEAADGSKWKKWNAEAQLPTQVHNTAGTFDVYKTDDGAVSAGVLGIVENWTDSDDGNGNRYGFLLEYASASTDLPNNRGHNINGSNRLYVSVPDGESPVGREYLALLPGHGFLITNCQSCVFEDGVVGLTTDPANGDGYGIRVTGTSSANQFTRMEYDGCQYHGFGDLSNLPTPIVTDCIYRTHKRGTDSQFVVYSSSGSGQAVVTRNVFWPVPWLDVDKNPVNEWQGVTLTGGVSAVAAHNNDVIGAGFGPAGLVVRDSVQMPNTYLPERACYFFGSTAGGLNHNTPTDMDDYETYPIQFIDCVHSGEIVSGGGPLGSTNGINKSHVATVRCYQLIDGSDASRAATPVGGFIGATCNASSSSYEASILRVSCVAVCSTNDTAGDKIVYARINGAEIRSINCSDFLDGAYSGNEGMYGMGTSVGLLSFVRCIFDCDQANAYLIPGGGASKARLEGSQVVFEDCIYSTNLNSTYNNAYGGINAGYFESTIDTEGVYDIDPDYDDDATLEPDATLKALKVDPVGTGPIGINNLPYDGSYGAWQYGALGGNRSRSRSRLR